ncbi:MAG: FtsX-like permease family protein [Myxococcales bacterium]|nr:FtsX-like permease family protein [Myxococcales bacterium]
MVSPLDRKLLRDLASLKGQVLTIAIVVALGVAVYLSFGSAKFSLVRGTEDFYRSQRFADVFASLERAPDSLRSTIERLPGVASVETRVSATVLCPMPGMIEPAVGRAHSIPDFADPALDVPFVVEGRLPEPHRDDEVLVNDAFAQSHRLHAGDRLDAIIHGTRRTLRVVGLATSPEYLVAMSAELSSMGNERFVVLWMRRAALAPVARMQGGFNDVAIRLQRDARPEPTVAALDRLFVPYGGRGARPRSEHLSHKMLQQELQQIDGSSTVLPAMFLGVAAFLVNVVLGRLVRLQRGQLAMLKAVGYSDRRIALHYVQMVLVIVTLGIVVGALMGREMARWFIGLYREFFRVPNLGVRLDLSLLARGAALSFGSGVIGAIAAVRGVAKLAPAQAMQPEPPAKYGDSALDRAVSVGLLGPASRMIARELVRRPLRLLLSSLGIAMAVAILVAGRSMFDALPTLERLIFHEMMREQLAVRLTRPVAPTDLSVLRTIPGVLGLELQRTVPVRMRAGSRTRETSLVGHPERAELRRVLDHRGRELRMVRGAVLLTRYLGQLLDVRVGDRVQIEVLEGERTARTLTVGGFTDEPFGLQGHLLLDDLWSILGQTPSVDMALLVTDPAHDRAIVQRVVAMPGVGGVASARASLARFREQSGRSMGASGLLLVLAAGAIAAGVVYNNARVALAMRERDLATLRVLGMSRADVSRILLGEMAVQVLLGLGPGYAIGAWMAKGAMAMTDPEMYRLPLALEPFTYVYATVVTLVAALMSALVVRRRVDSLDLVGVLKTRE